MQGMVAGKRKQGKSKTKMGERHHRYVWYDGSSKQRGGGQASISQRHRSVQRRPDEDMLQEEEEVLVIPSLS